MFRRMTVEDGIKSAVGLVFLIAGVLLYGPGELERLGRSVQPAFAYGGSSTEHEVALQMESELERVDVLNIRKTNIALRVTVVDIGDGAWSEEELVKLADVSLYPADLAVASEVPIAIQMWTRNQAMTVDAESVDVYLHVETLICPLSSLKVFDGVNSADVIRNCVSTQGLGLQIDAQDISWTGRGQ